MKLQNISAIVLLYFSQKISQRHELIPSLSDPAETNTSLTSTAFTLIDGNNTILDSCSTALSLETKLLENRNEAALDFIFFYLHKAQGKTTFKTSFKRVQVRSSFSIIQLIYFSVSPQVEIRMALSLQKEEVIQLF
ncbi:hypothetical protein ACJX0J_018191, partial [Zea mays]